jgi:hypothetical protein
MKVGDLVTCAKVPWHLEEIYDNKVIGIVVDVGASTRYVEVMWAHGNEFYYPEYLDVLS